MHPLAELWKYHPALVGAFFSGTTLWLFNAFVDSMPELPKDAGFWQTTMYRFVHVVSSRLSQMKQPPER